MIKHANSLSKSKIIVKIKKIKKETTIEISTNWLKITSVKWKNSIACWYLMLTREMIWLMNYKVWTLTWSPNVLSMTLTFKKRINLQPKLLYWRKQLKIWRSKLKTRKRMVNKFTIKWGIRYHFKKIGWSRLKKS